MSIADVKQRIAAANSTVAEAQAGMSGVIDSLSEAAGELRGTLEGGGSETINDTLNLIQSASELVSEANAAASSAVDAANEYAQSL